MPWVASPWFRWRTRRWHPQRSLTSGSKSSQIMGPRFTFLRVIIVFVLRSDSPLGLVRFEDDKKQWSGMLREMRYAAGSSCVSMRLNAARMPKL